MATPSGLGVSTGIGKGEAQVFAPVKSEYFKNKANLALKEKAAQEKAFVDIGSAPVFNPDTEEYKQELAKVRQFYRDNQRSILEGDFDTKLKLNQLTSGLTQWAANSNAEGKVWEALKKKAATDENSIYQKDLDALSQYYNTPYSKRRNMDLKLRGRFDKKKFFDEGIAEIKKLPFDPATLRIEELKQADGTIKEVIINEKNQDVGSLNKIALAGYSAAELEYGKDQVGNEITLQEYKDFLRPYFGSDRSVSPIGKGDTININTGGKDEENPWAFNDEVTETTLNTPYGVDAIKNPENKNKISYNSGTIKLIGQKALKDDIKLKIDLPTGFVPLDAAYSSKETKDGKPTKIKGLATRGEFFNIEDSRKSIKSSDTWIIQSFAIYPTYPKGYKTSEKNSSVDISGFPIGQEEIDTERFKKESPNGVSHNFYVKVQNKYKDELLLPFYKAEDSIMQKYKTDKQKKYFKQYKKDTREYLINKHKAEPNSGWDQAYFDFTGKEVPTSSNKSNPNSQSKGTTVTFQGKEYKLQAGEEIRKKDGKFYIINANNNTARPI